MDGNKLIVAPCALNPIMAQLAAEIGFQAVYMSGGSLGWFKSCTEANLTLPEMVEIAVEMRAVCKLPIVLDAGGGWGDPVHVHHTVALAKAAGFAAIEIEDQYLPRQVRHHLIGEHRRDKLVPSELMVKKVQAAHAESQGEIVIIARTNAVNIPEKKGGGIEAALERAKAYRDAGADMLFVHTRNVEQLRKVGTAGLGLPLMTFAPPEGFIGEKSGLKSELESLGYRFAASSGSTLAAMYKAARQSMKCLFDDTPDPFFRPAPGTAELDTVEKAMEAAKETAGLYPWVEIERRTMGDD